MEQILAPLFSFMPELRRTFFETIPMLRKAVLKNTDE
jgi:hypothetical protein